MFAVGRVRPDPDLSKTCSQCCAFLAFRRHEPSVIDASDRVEHAVHLIMRHGFVK
jgi:hypothetical protein